MRILYIDDIRYPERWHQEGMDNVITVVRTYKEAIELLNNGYDVIDLDNDLGEEKEGYDIAKYMVENNIEVPYIYIHTMNPVARKNMVQLFERYFNSEIIIY